MRSYLVAFLIFSIFTVSLSSVNHSIHSFFCELELIGESDHETHVCTENHGVDCTSNSEEQGDSPSSECTSTTCPVIAFSSAVIFLDTAHLSDQILVSFEFARAPTQCAITQKLGKYNLVRGPPAGSTV